MAKPSTVKQYLAALPADRRAALEAIIDDTGLPATLSQADVPEADLPMLAEDAMLQQRLLVNNPREVLLADALEIYRAAF